MGEKRTDLAVEARELGGEAQGVESLEGVREGFPLTTVEVTTPAGARAIGKPVGTYHTLDLTGVGRREPEAFPRAAQAVAGLLRSLLPDRGEILVVGLGNRAITPDAVGPRTCDKTLVTRHLDPRTFGGFRPVSALAAGVLGTTGVESGELALALIERLRPAAVVAVDALCARRVERLCATVQLCDTGITPGSGVGNHRFSLSRETLGVPVVALGVPTVVEGATLCADLLEELGNQPPQNLPGASLFVTPRDIHQRVEDMARVLGHGITLALQPHLTWEDLTALVE